MVAICHNPLDSVTECVFYWGGFAYTGDDNVMASQPGDNPTYDASYLEMPGDDVTNGANSEPSSRTLDGPPITHSYEYVPSKPTPQPQEYIYPDTSSEGQTQRNGYSYAYVEGGHRTPAAASVHYESLRHVNHVVMADREQDASQHYEFSSNGQQ